MRLSSFPSLSDRQTILLQNPYGNDIFEILQWIECNIPHLWNVTKAGIEVTANVYPSGFLLQRRLRYNLPPSLLVHYDKRLAPKSLCISPKTLQSYQKGAGRHGDSIVIGFWENLGGSVCRRMINNYTYAIIVQSLPLLSISFRIKSFVA